MLLLLLPPLLLLLAGWLAGRKHAAPELRECARSRRSGHIDSRVILTAWLEQKRGGGRRAQHKWRALASVVVRLRTC